MKEDSLIAIFVPRLTRSDFDDSKKRQNAIAKIDKKYGVTAIVSIPQ